jgi:hypothetical protein
LRLEAPISPSPISPSPINLGAESQTASCRTRDVQAQAARPFGRGLTFQGIFDGTAQPRLLINEQHKGQQLRHTEVTAWDCVMETQIQKWFAGSSAAVDILVRLQIWA